MSDTVQYDGAIFQVLRRTKNSIFQIGDRTIEKYLELEVVRRPPGVRALVVQSNKLLLTYEYRYELDSWDYRLPGGKVFDTNISYCSETPSSLIMNNVVDALKRELREEANIEIQNYSLLNVSHCGLTVEWDLYYFLVNQFNCSSNKTIQKSEYEYIQNLWVDFSTALDLCLSGAVSESRSAYEIIRYILKWKEAR